MTVLYLLPNLLTDLESHQGVLPASVDQTVIELDYFIAESEKAARHYLKRFQYPPPKTFREIPIRLLNEHSTEQNKRELIAEMSRGGKWGLISDCGMPCLADPGADLVLMSRQKGFAVHALPGPSSILLGLVLSGLGGQRFTFHGYLPREQPQLLTAIRQLEKNSKESHASQVFIETPYRNQKLFELLLSTLQQETFLCLAFSLTDPLEQVVTQKVKEWNQKGSKSALIEDFKRPCVFILRA